MTEFSTAFKVINVRNCPYYSVDDRFILNDQSVKVPDGLPSCLILVREFTDMLFSLKSGEAEDSSFKNGVYTCGGCTGLIKFQVDDSPAEMETLPDKQQETDDFEDRWPLPGKPKKSGVVVSGSLNELSPSELLQFFHMHQKTGKLLLYCPSGTARVAFREGAIIGARFGEMEDKEAIFAMLAEKTGKFSFLSGIPESLMEVDNIGDFMMVLMDGLKRLDESG